MPVPLKNPEPRLSPLAAFEPSPKMPQNRADAHLHLAFLPFLLFFNPLSSSASLLSLSLQSSSSSSSSSSFPLPSACSVFVPGWSFGLVRASPPLPHPPSDVCPLLCRLHLALPHLQLSLLCPVATLHPTRGNGPFFFFSDVTFYHCPCPWTRYTT